MLNQWTTSVLSVFACVYVVDPTFKPHGAAIQILCAFFTHSENRHKYSTEWNERNREKTIKSTKWTRKMTYENLPSRH